MFDWIRDQSVYFIPIQLLLAMLGMGATLSVRDFLDVFKRPKSVTFGVALQWIWVPLLGQVYIKLWGMGEGWAVGLVLITIVPGGAMSNLFTFIAKGNAALSISVTVVTTVGCLATVPLLLRLFAAPYMPPDFVFPAGRIIFEVTFYLIIPLAVGMAVYRWAHRAAKTVSMSSVYASLALVLLIALGALGSGQISIGAYGWLPPMQILLFGILMTYVSAEFCRLFRRLEPDALALSVEIAIRNGGIGLLLTRYFFVGQAEHAKMLYAVLFYTGLSLWLALPMMIRHRQGKSILFFREPLLADED